MPEIGQSVDTREDLLSAALKCFAHAGYSATPVQQIVDAAGVTKPTLYYYFANKAALYQALLDHAHNERYRLMQEAAARATDLRGQLVEILAATFQFLRGNRELIRLAFSTAFAAPGEVPPEIRSLDKSVRNFEFIHALIRRGVADGTLDSRFSTQTLAVGIYGLLTIHVMGHVLFPEETPDRQTAEQIVDLFLQGAAAPPRQSPAPLNSAPSPVAQTLPADRTGSSSL